MPPRQPGNRTYPESARPRARSRASAGPALPGYDSGRGHDPGQYPSTWASPRGSGYNPPAYGLSPGYPAVQGDDPDPGHNAIPYNRSPARFPAPAGPAGHGQRRLYAVPDDASAIRSTGQAPAGRVLAVAEDQATAIRQAAEAEAAELRRRACDQAAAIRQDAERQAAELRSSVMAMSAELGQVAAYVTQSLGKHALRAGPQDQLGAGSAAELAPGETLTRPPQPAAGPAEAATIARPAPARPDGVTVTRPGAPPATRTRPGAKPGGRQATAVRKAVACFSVLLAVGLISGGTELALHGYKFFVFRSAGTGATNNNGLQENQGPGLPGAPGAHLTAAPAKQKAHHQGPKPAQHHRRHRRHERT